MAALKIDMFLWWKEKKKRERKKCVSGEITYKDGHSEFLTDPVESMQSAFI